jgi:hypothetical protein
MKESLRISKKERDLMKLVLMDVYVNSKTYYLDSEREMMIEVYEILSELFETNKM